MGNEGFENLTDEDLLYVLEDLRIEWQLHDSWRDDPQINPLSNPQYVGFIGQINIRFSYFEDDFVSLAIARDERYSSYANVVLERSQIPKTAVFGEIEKIAKEKSRGQQFKTLLSLMEEQ